MHEKLPGCRLMARPYIEGRVKQLKKAYRFIDWLRGVENSGFGWNDERKCILADQTAFDEWVKSHPQAKGWNRMPFPFFDSLAVVYAKDYVSGDGAEDMAEAVQHIDLEDKDHLHQAVNMDSISNVQIGEGVASLCLDDSIQSSPMPPGHAMDPLRHSAQRGGGRSKRHRLEVSINSQLERLGSLFEASLNKFSELTENLSVEKDIHDKRGRVEAKLAKIVELTDVNRIKIGRKLVQDPSNSSSPFLMT